MTHEQKFKKVYPGAFIIKFTTYQVYLSLNHFRRGRCLLRGARTKREGWILAREMQGI
jgi:hypothetical protein